uniref:Uncharacterized protein n=1 Tax=Tetraselmis sp. GSL018 TaxID=582737 RepID=A0A061SDP4_9CHLO
MWRSIALHAGIREPMRGSPSPRSCGDFKAACIDDDAVVIQDCDEEGGAQKLEDRHAEQSRPSLQSPDGRGKGDAAREEKSMDAQGKPDIRALDAREGPGSPSAKGDCGTDGRDAVDRSAVHGLGNVSCQASAKGRELESSGYRDLREDPPPPGSENRICLRSQAHGQLLPYAVPLQEEPRWNGRGKQSIWGPAAAFGRMKWSFGSKGTRHSGFWRSAAKEQKALHRQPPRIARCHSRTRDTVLSPQERLLVKPASGRLKAATGSSFQGAMLSTASQDSFLEVRSRSVNLLDPHYSCARLNLPKGTLMADVR